MPGYLEGRITHLESRIRNRACTTCYGAAYAHVFVPQGEDPDAPEYNPTHCTECGMPLRTISQIIGIAEWEMFPESAESAG